MSPNYKPPCEHSNSCLLLSQSSSFTLLTPHPLASTPLPLPDLALTTDPHAEEAEFHTSLQQPWPLGLLRSWEREPEPDPVRKVGMAVRCPPQDLLPGWPYPGLGAGISCPEAPGLDTMGVISHHRGIRTMVGALHLAVGFPGLSCVNLYFRGSSCFGLFQDGSPSPSFLPSVTLGQLPFTSHHLGLSQLKMVMTRV